MYMLEFIKEDEYGFLLPGRELRLSLILERQSDDAKS